MLYIIMLMKDMEESCDLRCFIHQGLHTFSSCVATFKSPVVVLQSMGCNGDGVCLVDDDVDDAGVSGKAYGVEVPSRFGEPGGVYGLGTLITKGDTLSISLSRCPRWVISLVPRWISTPGMVAKQRDTSLAQWVYPARKRSASTTGL